MDYFLDIKYIWTKSRIRIRVKINVSPQLTVESMAGILDGNSKKMDAHIFQLVICTWHLIRPTTIANLKFVLGKELFAFTRAQRVLSYPLLWAPWLRVLWNYEWRKFLREIRNLELQMRATKGKQDVKGVRNDCC